MRQKLLAFVLATLFVVHLLPLSTYAETVQQDGLIVTLQTTRDSYKTNEPIQASIEIENTNETEIQNIQVMPYASQPYVLENPNQSTISVGTIKDKSTEKLDVVFVRGEDIVIDLPLTGDSSHPLFWLACLVASLVSIYILHKKKGAYFLSLFLCLCIASSVIPVCEAEAANENAPMLVVEKTVDVDGESITVSVGISYHHAESHIGTLTANQTTILANNSASPVYFYVQAEGVFTSINLINALTGLNVATMLDDGKYSVSGDDLPNDDIYSCIVNVPSASVGTYKYYARMTDSCGNITITNEVEIIVVSEFVGTDLEAMEHVHESLEKLVLTSDYQNMSIDERSEAVEDQLQIHATNGLIDGNSIKYDTHNQMYTFTHACGVLGGIMLIPFHSDLNGSAPMTRAEREMAAIANQHQGQTDETSLMPAMPAYAYEDMEIGDAKIYYAFDEAVNSSRYPYYLSMADDWSESGLSTSIDQAVTVEKLKSINVNKVSVLSMHGVSYQSVEKSGAVLCLQEETTDSKNQLYTSDLKKRNLATVTLDSGKTCYWVFASFFADHYGANDLQNTFIFSEACSFWGENSTSDKSMALAFEKAGATAIVGFYNPVFTEYSRDMLQQYMESLLDGKTAYEALVACQEKYGKDDSKYTGSESNSFFSSIKDAAYALFGGSTESKLIESDLKNTSFEQSSTAAGWNTTGDVRVLTRLGSLKPTNGSRMAILTTGIGSAESSYLNGTEGSILAQTFIVPSDAGSVQFMYDVVSEEPMEYVDSMFDDKFAVRILGSNGQLYREKTIESVNESIWYPISGIDFEGGDDTTYHTQWKTGAIDISGYRNQAITLQFVVYDVGDSIYDTAALIDDVKILSGSGLESDACDLILSQGSWLPLFNGESTTITVSKHDGHDFSVEVKQLDPDGNALNSASEWLTASKSGSNIKLTASMNYAAKPRTATVSVTCACGRTKKLIVTQTSSGSLKPTLKLRIGDSYYGENDTYGTLTAGDRLYLTAEYTNAKRLYIRVYNEVTGDIVVDNTFNSEVTGSSAQYYPAFNKDIESGTYVVEATVSNSHIPNDVWAQKVTVKTNVKVNENKGFDPIWPLDDYHTITTLYYYNEYKNGGQHACSTYSKENMYIAGIDVDVPENTAVRAVEDGNIILIGTSFGLCLKIEHENGFYSTYGHLNRVCVKANGNQWIYDSSADGGTVHEKVKSNSTMSIPVKKGDIIAYSGNTGNSTGAHLHFDVYQIINNKWNKFSAWEEYYRDEPQLEYASSVIAAATRDRVRDEYSERLYDHLVKIGKISGNLNQPNQGTENVSHSEIGSISRKYETTAGCGSISSGNGDAGGKSYGSYQFASKTGAPLTFVNWMIQSSGNQAWISMGDELLAAYNTDGKQYGITFDQTWSNLAENDSDEFYNAQTEYVYEKYYLNYLNKINDYKQQYGVTGLAEYGTPENIYPLAVHQMIWARAVQGCPSPKWIAEAWSIADKKDGNDDNIVDPKLWVYQVYWEASKTDRDDPRDRDSDKTAFIIQAKDCIVENHDYTEKLAGTYLVYFHTSTSPWQAGVYRRLNPVDGKEYKDIADQL